MQGCFGNGLHGIRSLERLESIQCMAILADQGKLFNVAGIGVILGIAAMNYAYGYRIHMG